jgi:hypothetical protein
MALSLLRGERPRRQRKEERKEEKIRNESEQFGTKREGLTLLLIRRTQTTQNKSTILLLIRRTQTTQIKSTVPIAEVAAVREDAAILPLSLSLSLAR